MTVATEYAAAPAVAFEHRPWWRSRVTLAAAIVGTRLDADHNESQLLLLV